MSRLLNIVLCFLLFVPIADAAKDAMEFPTGLPISVIGAGSGTPSSGNCAQFDSNGDLVDAGAPCGGAGASPGGANTQVQFNDSGSFGGNAGFIFNKTSGNVGIGTTVPQGKLVVMNGNVGIGTIAPPALLSLGQTLGSRVFFLSDGRIQAGAYDFNDENPFHFQYTMSDNPYSSNRYFLRSTATVSRSGVTDSYGYGAVLGKIIARNNSTYALIEGVYGYSSVDDSANVTTSTGGRLIAYHDGTGAVTNQYGTIADTGVRDTGNVANNVGVIVTTPTISSSGTITGHNYGIKIEDQDVGTGQKYAIYTGGTSKSYFGGNVGIGTLNPTAKLNVNGTATISGDLTTNITGSTQCVQADSSGVLSGTGSACGSGGGGTNYWNLSTGNVGINTSWNVGIGSTNPQFKLDVNGPIRIGSTSGEAHLVFRRTDNFNYIQTPTNATLGFVVNGDTVSAANSKIVLLPNGNVGIGTNVPTKKFEIYDNSQNEVAAIRNQWGSYFGFGGTSSITPYIQGYDSAGTPVDINLQQTSMNVGIGSATPTAKLHIVQTQAVNALRVDDVASDTTPFVIDQSGNVGIGTPLPRQKLSVGEYLDLYSGVANSPSQSSIRASSANLVLNGRTGLYLNFDSGTTGVSIGNGASGTVSAFDNAGNIGIGTAAPFDGNTLKNRLNVFGSAAIGSAIFANATAPTNGLIVSGNVGIGTTIPGGALTVMNGNVGIGTWKPAASLEVKGGNILGQNGGIVNDRVIGITIDGGGSAITAGHKGYVRVPYACTIQDWYLLADQSGSLGITVQKDSTYPPTTTICGTECPTISSNDDSSDTSLSSWTTSVSANDYFGFNVGVGTTITRANLTIKCKQ